MYTDMMRLHPKESLIIEVLYTWIRGGVGEN